MSSAWFDSTVAWISAHPVAAGGLVFLVAFCDALAVVGIVVPALPLLFAVGVLIGLGHISGPYAVASAALGALAGDALSYWIGHRWGSQLRDHWPFRRYPQLLDRGEQLFRRHGAKGIVIARYVGAVRPFVPAVAGMLGMPLRRYLPASLFAAVAWAASFLAPGWLLGASYDAVAAVADRLLLVLVALAAALALVWAAVLYTWRWFAGHADALLARMLRWSRAHPHLGPYAQALIDPNRPESASLALLAACLLAIGWAWFALLALVWTRGGPLLLDRNVHAAMETLRNPLADRLMAALAALGDASVLVPSCALALGWLLWRRRFIAAAHWLGAVAFGLALTAGLGAWIDMPRPPNAPAGFGFPSIAVTMATIAFGFFAVLIARELPGRNRVWPYLLTGVVVTALGFSRLYLGAHWLSDVLGGALLGIVWLLLLGLAYRRHVARSFWMRPLAGVFYGAFAIAALWHAPRVVDASLQRYSVPTPHLALDSAAWWRSPPSDDPARRSEWPLDLEVAGDLAPLRVQLATRGWSWQEQADWVDVVGLLDERKRPFAQPVLPSALDGRPEALLMKKPGAAPGEIAVLRLWPAGTLADGEPLWTGMAQTMHFSRRLGIGLWRPGGTGAHASVRGDLAGLEWKEAQPAMAPPVLRVRTSRVHSTSRSN